MPLYLISYDLIKPEKDYPDLIDHLEQIGAKRILLSEWALRGDFTAKDVYADVWKNGKMGVKDKLFVTRMNGWVASPSMGIKIL